MLLRHILRKFVVLLTLAATGAWSQALGASLPKICHWHLLGTIGEYPVQMELTVEDGRIDGSYFYERRGGSLELSGEGSLNTQLILGESDTRDSKVTGIFQLTTKQAGSNAVFSGTWSAPGSKKTLPVHLHATVAFRRTFQSNEIPSLYVEEPIFLDGFKGIAEGKVQGATDHETLEAPAWDEEHGIRFVVIWHRPDTELSLLRVTSENVGGSRSGQGKADYGYDHFHYRFDKGRLVPLRLNDFFKAGDEWLALIGSMSDFKSESPRQFTFDATGLHFHEYEWMDQNKGKASWMALSDVLKPGWPQALGIEPMELYSVPEPGSSLRSAILGAAASTMAERLNEDERSPSKYEVRWRVNDIRYQDGWAMLSGEPLWGLKGSYEVDQVEHRDEDSDPGMDFILQRKAGKWSVFKIIEPPAPEIQWSEQLEGVPQGIFEGVFPPGFNP